jgi:hypothetical protein
MAVFKTQMGVNSRSVNLSWHGIEVTHSAAGMGVE